MLPDLLSVTCAERPGPALPWSGCALPAPGGEITRGRPEGCESKCQQWRSQGEGLRVTLFFTLGTHAVPIASVMSVQFLGNLKKLRFALVWVWS